MIPAHSAAISILATLYYSHALPIWERATRLDSVIAKVCAGDVHPVIVLVDKDALIEIEADTPFGEAILTEARVCSDVPPCAAGCCEFEESELCIWCGAPKVTP